VIDPLKRKLFPYRLEEICPHDWIAMKALKLYETRRSFLTRRKKKRAWFYYTTNT